MSSDVDLVEAADLTSDISQIGASSAVPGHPDTWFIREFPLRRSPRAFERRPGEVHSKRVEWGGTDGRLSRGPYPMGSADRRVLSSEAWLHRRAQSLADRSVLTSGGQGAERQ